VRLLRKAAEFVEDHPAWRGDTYTFLQRLKIIEKLAEEIEKEPSP
jgi:hypothetical protein